MSTDLTKRALTAGLGAAGLGIGALALMAPRASADTPFSSFTFPAAGAPTARTLPERLSEIKNVKDHGAIGNGTADDTAAVQAAIDAATVSGVTANANQKGGVVYLPPGSYKITSPLKNNTAATYVRLVGAGKHVSQLFGSNVTGYVVDQNDGNVGKIEGIEGLYIRNTSTNAASGAVRFNNAAEGHIRNCLLSSSINALDASSNTFNSIVSDSEIICSGVTAGSTGIYSAQIGVYNCTIMGWDVGLQGHNAGLLIQGSRFEVNNTGIVIGRDRTGASSGLSGFCIQGNSTERNNTAILLASGSAGFIAGNTVTGTVGVDGLSTPQYGIRVLNGTGVAFIGNTVSCRASIAGIDIGSVSGAGISFLACLVNIGSGAGVTWRMPTTNLTAFSFLGCNTL